MHARSMCFRAEAGAADELARVLVLVSDGLGSMPGCISWIVARNPQEADEVWVQELWSSEQAADEALTAEGTGDGPTPEDVMRLCDGPPRRTDLIPVGGVGFAAS